MRWHSKCSVQILSVIMIKTRENRENYRFTEDTHFYLFGEARAKKIDERMCFDLG